MLNKKSILLLAAAVFVLLNSPVFGQYKIEGYLRNTENYTIPNVFPSSKIEVFNQGGLAPGTVPATIYSCANPTTPLSNPFNVSTSYYCFIGSASSYDVLVYADGSKVRRVVSEQILQTKGVYKLTDFGALDNNEFPTSDNTYAIESAMAQIGTRAESGGKLIVPNGVYKVSSASSAMFPIVLPPGLTFEGTNGKVNFSSSRIQGEFSNLTLFKITNNSDRITIRDIAFVNILDCNPSTPGICYVRPGTKAVHGEVGDDNATQFFLASSVTVQGFEEGFYFSGTSGSANNGQFGSARIENSIVADCRYPIRLNAQNAEFDISNSVLNTVKDSSNEEASLRIDKAGPLTMTKIYGGVAFRDVNNKPLAFVLVKGRHSTIRINDSLSENVKYNFLYDYNPPSNDIRPSIIFDGVGFGDLTVFKGNATLTSFGSAYASNGVQFWGTPKGGNSNNSEVYSYGDRFSELTNDLQVCPEAAGVSPQYFPPERPNGDFHRLTLADITPVAGDLDRNKCRRDFYLYNSPGELNRVVMRTAQRKYSAGDSNGLTATQSQTGIEITAPPVFDEYLTVRPGIDRFKTWGYRIERNSTTGSLDFLGNQKPPSFGDGNASNFRFNGNVYPTEDNAYELGNGSVRWSLVRGVTVVSGDTILSDKVTGKELYKIHEDENFIYFSDIRTGKTMMRLGTDGNLYIAGKVVENSQAEPAEKSKQKAVKKPVRSKKQNRNKR